MIKSLMSYNLGNLCGLQFEEKFIKGNFDKFAPTGAMSIGTWFEYKLTGAKPKDGKIPEPQYTKKGELTAEYAKMLNHIDSFKSTMMFYGFTIETVGEKIVHGDLEGTLDLRCRATQDIKTESGVVIKKGESFIVDLKTSGQLDNKWADYGWELNNLSNKVNIVLQPILYKYIEKLNGRDTKFLFFLYNTQDKDDCRIINFICDDSAFLELEKTIDNSRKMVEKHKRTGWKAKPNKKICAKCPIKIGGKYIAPDPPITDYYHDSSTA